MAVGCSSPTAPPNNAIQTQGDSLVAGTVFLHTANGVVPAGNSTVFGWLETGPGGSGQTSGPVPTRTDGSYNIMGPSSTVRVRVAAMTSTRYQPCAVVVPRGSKTSGDVHLISDPSALGAHLPDSFLANQPLLSGVVYEITSQGRQPLANAEIDLDGRYGDGQLIATQRTDSDGRFTFCGVPGFSGVFVMAFKNGFDVAGKDVLPGMTTVELELRAK